MWIWKQIILVLFFLSYLSDSMRTVIDQFCGLSSSAWAAKFESDVWLNQFPFSHTWLRDTINSDLTIQILDFSCSCLGRFNCFVVLCRESLRSREVLGIPEILQSEFEITHLVLNSQNFDLFGPTVFQISDGSGVKNLRKLAPWLNALSCWVWKFGEIQIYWPLKVFCDIASES